jgi:hypothetical protein
MNRYYVACFYKKYKDELQYLADDGHNIEQMGNRTLPPQQPRTTEDERSFEKTWISETYDPWLPNGQSTISTRAWKTAHDMAESHADGDAAAIVRGTAALENLARHSFDRWLSNAMSGLHKRAYRNELQNLDTEEMCRLYVVRFIDTYRAQIRHLETIERIPRQPDGPVIRVLDTRHSADARIYDVELIDPEYSIDPVRFEVMIPSEGEAELRER